MVYHSIIPARFLSLTAHLVATIMIFWAREPNVLSCVPVSAGVESDQYRTKDTQLLVALSLAVACTAVELVGLISGLSMFTGLPTLFSIAAHVSAAIGSAVFVIDEWACDSYWYILGLCSIIPCFVELLTIIATLKCKIFI